MTYLSSLMQTAVSSCNANKNEPHDTAGHVRVEAFAHGLPAPVQPDDVDESDQTSGSPDQPDVDPSGSSGPSSSTNEVYRQDVMLFHLQQPPIRVMLSWYSFEDMVTEIAHHFAVDRALLVDAYEVVTPVGTPRKYMGSSCCTHAEAVALHLHYYL